jgi:hypothetical protein
LEPSKYAKNKYFAILSLDHEKVNFIGYFVAEGTYFRTNINKTAPSAAARPLWISALREAILNLKKTLFSQEFELFNGKTFISDQKRVHITPNAPSQPPRCISLNFNNPTMRKNGRGTSVRKESEVGQV